MGTINNESKPVNSNQLIIDQFKSLFERFNRKLLRKKELQDKLIFHAKKTGFINNVYRKQAWNLLIQSPHEDYSAEKTQIESHQYYEQTRLDVIRTLKRFPPNYSDSERSELQDELILIIMKILIKHGELHYYQGYHDICLTFLLVLGEEQCLSVMDSITMSHLKSAFEMRGATSSMFNDHLHHETLTIWLKTGAMVEEVFAADKTTFADVKYLAVRQHLMNHPGSTNYRRSSFTTLASSRNHLPSEEVENYKLISIASKRTVDEEKTLGQQKVREGGSLGVRHQPLRLARDASRPTPTVDLT